jgi:hypothetical protein
MTESELCKHSEDLSAEEKLAELLPINVQHIYVLERLGKTEDAKSLSSEIVIDKYVMISYYVAESELTAAVYLICQPERLLRTIYWLHLQSRLIRSSLIRSSIQPWRSLNQTSYSLFSLALTHGTPKRLTCRLSSLMVSQHPLPKLSRIIICPRPHLMQLP